MIPVSVGELFDKYTILQIKYCKITDPQKNALVKTEMDFLQPYIDQYAIAPVLFEKLHVINQKLWDIEDKIRDKEREHIFDQEFIDLARAVYITNDERSRAKNEINTFCNSAITDIKSYSTY